MASADVHHEIHRSNDMAIVRTTIVDLWRMSGWHNRRVPAPSAFSRFPPVHRADLEGQLRVEGGRMLAVRQMSRKGGEAYSALPIVRRLWRGYAPTRAASGTTGVRAKPVIPLRARNRLHRPEHAFRRSPSKPSRRADCSYAVSERRRQRARRGDGRNDKTSPKMDGVLGCRF